MGPDFWSSGIHMVDPLSQEVNSKLVDRHQNRCLKQTNGTKKCLNHQRWVSVQFSRSVVSDSLQPHESQHARDGFTRMLISKTFMFPTSHSHVKFGLFSVRKVYTCKDRSKKQKHSISLQNEMGFQTFLYVLMFPSTRSQEKYFCTLREI